MTTVRLRRVLASPGWHAPILATILLAVLSLARATPPTPWKKGIEDARELPTIPAAALERLKSDSGWRAGLVRHNLGVGQEVSSGGSAGIERDPGAAPVLVRPAPMAWSESSPRESEGSASGERLVHDMSDSETVRSRSESEPGAGTLSAVPSPQGETRRAEPHAGAEPVRAPVVEVEGTPERYRLLARFVVDGADYYFKGEAIGLRADELLAAGPCAYNHDPNKDGDQRDARWASEVWIWPAGTTGASTAPAGWLSVTALAVPEAWIARAADEFNAAVVTVPSLHGARGSDRPHDP